MKTIKFNNLVDKSGNTIEIEVPDDFKANKNIKEKAKLSATKIKNALK